MPTFYTRKGEAVQVDEDVFEDVTRWSWHVSSNGYVRRSTRAGKSAEGKWIGKVVYLHRYVMGITERHIEVDHRNRRDKLDNRRSNLRVCTPGQNQANTNIRKKLRATLRGVDTQTNGKTYFAIISYGGKSHYIGTYPTEEAAARAYDSWAKEVHGEFATLNFP